MNEEGQVKKLPFREKRKLLFRALGDIRRFAPGFMTAILFSGIANGISDFVPVIMLGKIVDGFASGRGLRYIFTVILIGVAATFIMRLPIYCISPALKHKAFRLAECADIMINNKILKMDYVKIENPEIHRQYDRVKTYATQFGTYGGGIYNEIVGTICEMFQGITYVVIALIVTRDLYTAVIIKGGTYLLDYALLALVVVMLVVQNIIRSKNIVREEGVELSVDTVRPNRIRNYFLDNYCGEYQAAKDVHIYGQKKFILKRTDELFDMYHKSKLRKDKVIIKQEGIDGIFDVVRSILIYGFVAGKAITGAISAGALVQDVQSFYQIQEGFNIIMRSMSWLSNYMFPLKLIYDFIDIADEQYMGSIPTEKRDDNEYEFEFHNVSFKYPASDEYVLKDINLKWRIGEKMALVGRNGSGKTTLIKLLCRLYDPTDGEITLNGINICKYSLEEYMDLFSVVFQDSKLFSFSLAENVAASMNYDSQRVIECVNRSGLSDRLKNMPQGIETCLYKDFDDKGVELSGGEAQKLELARAIYKGSPFVILDEPTAALDPIAENEIYIKFNEVIGTRTAIYISHRLSSCQFCDDIMVLDKGRLVEHGSHHELVAMGGIYSQMWQAQSEYYKEAI